MEPEQLARTSGTPIESDPSRLAARVNWLRTERGWTLAELSRLTKLSKPHLSRLESGQRQPSLAALLALARTYEAPLQSLLDSGAQPEPSPVVIPGTGRRFNEATDCVIGRSGAAVRW